MQTTSYSIKEFHQKTDPEEVIDRYFKFSDVLRNERDPDEPAIDRELRLKLIRDPNPHYFIAEWIVEIQSDEGPEIIANGEVNWSLETAPGFETNKHIASIGINVLPDHRRKGLAKKLLRLCVDKLTENKEVTTVFAGSWHEAGQAMCESCGGIISQSGGENRLRIEDVDWEMIREWRRQGRKLAEEEGITLQFFTDCPEDIIEEYSQVYQTTMNDQPLGEYDGTITITPKSRREDEKRNKDKDINWYTYITREADGRISGLTEMFAHEKISHKGFQNLTGVLKEYRGRGLGKWLKAEMLIWFTNEHPSVKYITTGNDITNAPMLSINERMGFKNFLTSKSYKFTVDDLVDRVKEI